MGKKRVRKTLTSQGSRRSIVAGVKEARRDRPQIQKNNDKVKAWKAGKNPWITVPGPASNMRSVKVRANALYGDPKHAMANLFKMRGDE